jgi:hypothetical protein
VDTSRENSAQRNVDASRENIRADFYSSWAQQ